MSFSAFLQILRSKQDYDRAQMGSVAIVSKQEVVEDEAMPGRGETPRYYRVLYIYCLLTVG